MTLGSDGIAISHDGKHLYDCPLSSRRLYHVRTDALRDEKAGDTTEMALAPIQPHSISSHQLLQLRRLQERVRPLRQQQRAAVADL